ncbi:MAG: hypothetical protein ACR2MT_11695 [Aurantibacter sp.]
MRISVKKKKGNNTSKILGLVALIGLLLAYMFFNRQQIYRSVAVVNGGSVLNDYLDAKFKFNSFFEDTKGPIRKDLVIQMGSSNYVKLQKERAKKTKNFINYGGMIRTQTNYYNADIELGEGKSKSKVGLFGGASDNFRDSNGFHFRVKFNGKEGFGKKMYNVLKPRSRGHNIDKLASVIHENLFKGVGIDYEPVNVTFNKSSFGIYLTEEYFDKYLIESKSHRESFIFKTMGKDSIKFKHAPDAADALTRMNLISSIVEDQDGARFAQLIDEEKMFGYFALSFLLNQHHSSTRDNLHFFYNSVTNKFEPIVREMHMFPHNDAPTLEEMKSIQRDVHFLLDDWMDYIGDVKFKSGIVKAMSKVEKEIDDLLNLQEYLDFKEKLIGNRNEMERNENVMLQNLKKLDFLTGQNEEPLVQKEISITRDTIISKDFTVDKNEKLVVQEGLTITLENNAGLFVYGGLKLHGSEDKPVTIIAKDDSSSFIYINSKEDSSFDYVHFKNLSALSRNLWQLPSAITAYETNVSLNNCTFDSNKLGDDMVNFFRCDKVKLANCKFINVLSDAIDTDFSNVEVVDTWFESIGNDAIDGSGSKVTITNCTFSKVEDKVISAGEASVFDSSLNTILDSELGLVCKDGSILTSENDSLANNNIDLVMFVKKKFYKQPIVHLKGTEVSTNLIEKKVEVTGLNIPKNVSKGVKDKLYGNEFGKSSK